MLKAAKVSPANFIRRSCINRFSCQIPLFFALLGAVCIQAVVVGPQPLHNNNRNGYRYNGPAHKYLPSEESHSHGSPLDSSHQHDQQGPSNAYNSHHYPAQEQHGQERRSTTISRRRLTPGKRLFPSSNTRASETSKIIRTPTMKDLCTSTIRDLTTNNIMD